MASTEQLAAKLDRSSSAVQSPHAGLDRFKKAGQKVMLGLGVVREMRRKTFRHADTEGKLPLSKKLTYAAPSLSLLSLTMLITIHALVYYESIGASLTSLAFFTAVARSFDVITDPLMGWISDSTRTPYGRRRPYIFVGCWGYAIAFFLLMSPPDLSSDGTGYWFGIFYIIFYLFDTIANVPYTAWGPELTDVPREREEVFFWRGLFDKVGVLGGAAGPSILLGAGVSDAATYRILAAGFGIYYICTMLLLVTRMRERSKSMEPRPVPLVPSILRAFKNVAFRPLLWGWILDFIALGMVSSMLPFFVKYVVCECRNDIVGQPCNPRCDSDTVLGIALGSLFLASGLAMYFWKLASLKYGKRKTWLAYNLVNSLTNFLFIFVADGDELWVYILAFLNGIPVGGQFLIEAILSDVIDYDEFLNGTRSEGSFTVFAQFIPKVVSIPASAIPLAIIAAAGFEPSINEEQQPQPNSVKVTIRTIFVVVPSLATLLSFVIKLYFPIKTEAMVEKISEGIVAHEAGKGAYDPVTRAKNVQILELSEEEQNTAWLLDNFGWDLLEAYSKGKPKSLIPPMYGLIFLSGSMMVGFLLTVGFTFSFLGDDSLAFIPSVASIMAGMMLCWLCVSILRLKAAKALQQITPPVELTKKIIMHKLRGQRGGDVIVDKIERQGTLLEMGDLGKFANQSPPMTDESASGSDSDTDVEVVEVEKSSKDDE